MSDPTNTAALEIALTLLDAGNMVKEGIDQHIQEHPELDNDTREILIESVSVINLLCRVVVKDIEAQVSMNEKLDEILENAKKR